MALTRAKKTQKVQFLAKELESSTTAIIGTFAKLTVAQDFELRKVIRGAGGKYRVVKNKLAAEGRRRHQSGVGAEGPEGRERGGLYLGRPGRAGQGVLEVGWR